jgi:hypothetical protein
LPLTQTRSGRLDTSSVHQIHFGFVLLTCYDCHTTSGGRGSHVEWFEWDEENLDHATRHGVSGREIEQAIRNATVIRKGRSSEFVDLRTRTDGGRRVRVIAQVLPGGVVRPVTAWEMKR